MYVCIICMCMYKNNNIKCIICMCMYKNNNIKCIICLSLDNKNMNKNNQVRKLHAVPLTVSIHWRHLHQDMKRTCTEIAAMEGYGKFSKATICRHMKKTFIDTIEDGRKQNKGRPPKLTSRDKRNILRHAEVLRTEYGFFNIGRLKKVAGISEEIHDETIRRCLKQAGLKYCHSRKKGVLMRKDLNCRLAFARKVLRLLDPSIWTEGIAFYLDGSGFTHKFKPFDQARTPTTMTWRRASDGLNFDRTAKGSHEGTGGKVEHFIAAIAYGKGVILAEQYEGNINGQMFADFVRKEFPNLFERSNNAKGKLFLQDGDPSQNSKKANVAIREVGAKNFTYQHAVLTSIR